MPQPIRAVLLDFDGTLVDSEPLHYDCWMEAVRPFGAGMDWDDYTRRLTGETDRCAAEVLLSEAGHEPAEDLIQQTCSAKRAAFSRRFCAELSIPNSISLWLRQAAQYLSLGVVSSSHITEVEPVLEQEAVRQYLNVLVCGNHVTRHKPDPEPYARALQLLNRNGRPLDPTECLVLEDSEAGVKSATTVGMTVRRVATPADVRPTLDALISLAALSKDGAGR